MGESSYRIWDLLLGLNKDFRLDLGLVSWQAKHLSPWPLCYGFEAKQRCFEPYDMWHCPAGRLIPTLNRPAILYGLLLTFLLTPWVSQGTCFFHNLELQLDCVPKSGHFGGLGLHPAQRKILESRLLGHPICIVRKCCRCCEHLTIA